MIYGEKIAGNRFLLNYMCNFSQPCPYYNVHREKMNRTFGHLLFDKWYKRPYSSYKLYFRLHPNER